MRDSEFRAWLGARYTNKNTISTQFSEARWAEREVGDLDKHYDEDGIDAVLQRLPTNYRPAVRRYREFRDQVDDVGEPTGEAPAVEQEEAVRFTLETDLQNALRNNLQQLGAGLVEADDGRERTIAAGRIDILAKDASAAWCVIELKAGRADERAVSQIAAYMGCLSEEESGEVKGILVAHDFSAKAVYAARVIPNLSLRRYGFVFTFAAVT